MLLFANLALNKKFPKQKQFSSPRSNIGMKRFGFVQTFEYHFPGGRGFIRTVSAAAVLALIILITFLSLNVYLQKIILRDLEKRFVLLEIKVDSLEVVTRVSFANQEKLIRAENEVIREQITSLADYVKNTTTPQINRAVSNINATNRNVGEIKQVYGDLLEEQQKKTLKNLYNEEALVERLKNAEILFKERKYRQAYEEYVIVANEQSENLEVQFFKYYSLFLLNKGDQSQYRQIKNGLLGIEQRGYTRAEIREVLGYIAAEEWPSNLAL